MVSFSKNYNKTSYYLLDIYLLYTFIFSVALWLGGYLFSENIFYDGFFSTIFLVTNYYYFMNGIGWSKLTSKNISWPGLFLIQTLSLIGMGHSEGTLGGIYLGVIPAAFGLFFFSSQKEWSIKNSKRGAVLFLIGMSVYAMIYGITKKTLFSTQDAFQFTMFILWGASIIYWGQFQAYEDRKSLLDIVVQTIKKGKKIEAGEWPRDRLFFHDLINQTHGIDLYLNQKISGNKNITPNESKILREEVRIMQSLIKDHFGYGHKNLFGVYEYVNFNVARKTIDRIVENFLPDNLVDKTFHYLGYLDDSFTAEKCMVHYPSFCRIFTNLVKNINEVKTDEVEFTFDYSDEGLSILVKNKVCYLKDDEENLARNLGNIILGVDRDQNMSKESGLGLESIATLVKERNGDFQFSLDGDYWVNKIFLPGKKVKKEEAAHSEDYKKAA